MIENATEAIAFACERTDAEVTNFTAAPRFIEIGKKEAMSGRLSLPRTPDDIERFGSLLDEKLREVNSDYDAKRYKDIALEAPLIHTVKKGSFYEWMKKRGKLGGQHKVPRLANHREYFEDLMEVAEGMV